MAEHRRTRSGTVIMPAIRAKTQVSRTRRVVSLIAAILVPLACIATAAFCYYKDGPPVQATVAAKKINWPHGVPRGITLSGLQGFIMSPIVISTLQDQTYAAKRYWHANTIRFQILQDRLVGRQGNRYYQYYMHDIRQVVGYALGQHLNVVVNAQTELSTGYSQSEPLPTHATTVFWDKIAHFYKNNPHVIFDLFNEPRYCSWEEWQQTHQALINHLRGEGVRNTFWVEGRWWGSTLEGVPLLKGENIVYTFHHPGAPWPDQAPVTVETWDNAFGYLADEGVPVVDAEFANFNGSYDWQDPYIPGYFKPGVLVKKYLRYLERKRIGLLAWSLLPGSLNRTQKYSSMSVEPQGDGTLINHWFRRLQRKHL